MQSVLMHNPGAGDGAAGARELQKLLHGAGYGVKRYSTKEPGWEAALAHQWDLAIAAGGDGTVAKVARGIAGRGFPMAILPTGTANNIARTLGLGNDLASLVAGWADANPRALDLAMTQGPWGERLLIESVGVGLFAEAMAWTERDAPDWRTSSGATGVLRRDAQRLRDLLRSSRAHWYDVAVDGVDHSGEYLAVEAMNIAFVGPNVLLAPGADPGDAALDVVLVPEAERHALDRLLEAAPGAPPPDAVLRTIRGGEVQLAGRVLRIRVDDALWPAPGREPSPGLTTAAATALPGAVEVLGGGQPNASG